MSCQLGLVWLIRISRLPSQWPLTRRTVKITEVSTSEKNVEGHSTCISINILNNQLRGILFHSWYDKKKESKKWCKKIIIKYYPALRSRVILIRLQIRLREGKTMRLRLFSHDLYSEKFKNANFYADSAPGPEKWCGSLLLQPLLRLSNPGKNNYLFQDYGAIGDILTLHYIFSVR
jgi:hypothetical protein